MDKKRLQRKLLMALIWSAGIAIVAGAIALLANIWLSASEGYLKSGGALALGGSIMVMLSAALYVFPVALLFFWIRDLYRYYQKKRRNS